MLLGERHERQHIGLGAVHEGGKLGHPGRSWSATDRHCLRAAPASASANAVPIQAETRRRWPLPACAKTLRMKCAAALPGGMEHAADGGFKALVAVRDDQFYAA